MNEPTYVWLAILAATIATSLTRLLPLFVLKRQISPTVLDFLRNQMPTLIMMLLIFYSLADVPWSRTYGWMEIVSIMCVGVLFLWRGNMLLSIFVGVVLYMILIRSF